MSVSPLASLLLDHHNAPPPNIYQLHDTPATSRHSQPNMSKMFDSLKKKISRRGSNPLTQGASTGTSKSATQGGYLSPLTSGAPPTRRPGNSGGNPFARRGADNEAPPAYTPGPVNPGFVASQTPITTTTDDDPYAFLRNFDTIFLIDDSGSMAGSRWAQVEKALAIIAPICAERDEDGVDVYFLNNSKVWERQRTAGDIVEIFQDARPGGQTFTGKRLRSILVPYLNKYKAHPDTTKPINVIVITDGQAHDDVQATILEAAKKLDKLDAPPWQVGIQFFQIGNDPQAREMLKQLDDEIGGGEDVRDIVDTVPFTNASGAELSATGIMKVVLGSVNRRLDRNSIELHC